MPAERVRPDPPQAHHRGQERPRGAQEEEGFFHEALGDGYECMSSWNDPLASVRKGVGSDLDQNFEFLGMGMTYQGLLVIAVGF